MPFFSCLFGRSDSSREQSLEVDDELSGIHNAKLYTYKELRIATEDFSPANKIGEGGFGSVYKGRLKDGKIAAIKVLSAESRQGTWDLYERRELVGLVDASLNGDFDAEQACRFLKIALLCTQDTPKLRPTMSSVVKMLTGEKAVDEKKITKPGLITDFMDLKVRGPQNTQMEPKNTSPDNSSDNPDTPNLSSEATSYSTFNTNDRST
ncbi:hypothetical protein Patl1_05085 [Pistacia atlantica]|uniref:Uncharacterized protein n=1 Tax=Pistacia atlantica TaxID=434234 RepID=A0ACC1BSB8_9ROSI|nr:hypothetical protein Patl1_05085 [Pistacia atlantica]